MIRGKKQNLMQSSAVTTINLYRITLKLF